MAEYDGNLSDIWKLRQRGKRDSDRHKELVKKAIKKHGRDIITEYNIIKSDGNKKVKVPVKFLDKYQFKYGKLNKKQGVGQGLGAKPGAKYRRTKASGKPGNKAGNQEGENIYEAEITVDELVDILLEELNLPWMDPKHASEIEVETEDLTSVDKKGILPNLDIKRTLIQNMKRNAAKGKPKIGGFSKDDFRYKVWEEEKEYHSNAAVYLMMDRSASMDKERTYIAKSFYFWMVQFLKRRYKNIDLVFIAHDTRAQIVEEKDFFTIAASGGTMCSSAFEVAYNHILANHPTDSWNNYVFEFSDGGNYPSDNPVCAEYVEKLLPLVRAIGYGEILLDDIHSSWIIESQLLSKYLADRINRTRFVSLQIKSREDVFLALKKFFNVKPKEQIDE